MLRVLIGTMYSGEREFERCEAALKSQRYMLFRHFLIEHLPQRAAHEKLYERFMQHAHAYELFLKLDADMVLADENRLGAAVAAFEQAPHLDHATFTVHDWLSDSPITGIHMYRSRVQWTKRDTQRLGDAPPQILGKRCCFKTAPSPLALHGPDPSPAQAFRYGLCRGLRAFQLTPQRLRPVEAIRDWRLLKRLWHHFNGTLDPRRGLALLGVEHVLTHPVTGADCDYTNPRFWQLLSLYAGMDPLEMRDHLRQTWSTRLRRELMWSANFTRQLVRRHRRARPPKKSQAPQ